MCIFTGVITNLFPATLLIKVENNFQILHAVNGYADWYDAKPEFGYRAVTIKFMCVVISKDHAIYRSVVYVTFSQFKHPAFVLLSKRLCTTLMQDMSPKI